MEFETNLVENLWTLYDKLIRKEWDDIFVYHRFYIKRPKPRTIDALTFEGRIVQHLLCDNGIAEWFDRRLVKECAACRKYLGTHYAAKMAKDHLHRFYLKHGIDGYILKIDIRKFFENIDHDVLKNKISKISEPSIREFLYYIIDHTPEPKGLPIGNQTSQWFALYYLDVLDRIIKEKYRCQYFVRYMDDLIIIHESKEFLQNLLNDLTLEAKNTLHIEFNRKTQITKLKEGFTFVGWRFSLNQSGKITVKLTSAKRKDINRKARESLYQYRMGLISQNKYNEKITSMPAYINSMNKNRGKIAPELIIIELSPQSLTQE